MDCKWVKLSKLGRFENFELKMPSDRVFSRLSENHKRINSMAIRLQLSP